MRQVKSSQFQPVYLLFGEEILLADKLVDAIRDKFLKKPEKEINFFVRYATEQGIDSVIGLASGMGLFSDKKMIVIKEVEVLKKADLDRFSKFISRSLDGICVVLHTHLTSLYQSRLKALEDKVTIVHLPPLLPGDLKKYVEGEFQGHGKTITSEAVDLLLFLVGHQLSDLIVQINNISQYFADKENIGPDDIERIASSYATKTVFELNNHIAMRNHEKASIILNSLLESGVSPQQILSQLFRHFSILWRMLGYIRSNVTDQKTIAGKLKIYPKYFPEFREQCRFWKSSNIMEVLKHIYHADYSLRNSTMTPQIILDMLSYQIINS